MKSLDGMSGIKPGGLVYHRATEEPMIVLSVVSGDEWETDDRSEPHISYLEWFAVVRRAVQTRELGIQYREDKFRVDELYTPLQRAIDDMRFAKELAALRDEMTEKKGPTLLQ